VDLAPRESATLTKKIGAENVDLDRFIFVKALMYAAYPLPDQEATCGVFILPMRGSGIRDRLINSAFVCGCPGHSRHAL
jgi:hypothetical protein